MCRGQKVTNRNRGTDAKFGNPNLVSLDFYSPRPYAMLS